MGRSGEAAALGVAREHARQLKRALGNCRRQRQQSRELLERWLRAYEQDNADGLDAVARKTQQHLGG
ncbi:MAG: hypothetical protein E6Q97_12370 [Desulfurellales bacterium]|nr:MAG: hypothetical protein E6Q97_12370 [Desulfurellales bacterium]